MEDNQISYELTQCLLAFQRGDTSEDAQVGAYLEAEKFLLLRALAKSMG